MTASLQIFRTTTNTPPAALLPGEFSVELGPFTKLWIGSASGNRLLLSSDPADATTSSARYLQVAGGTMLGALVLAANAANPLEPVTLQQLNAALTALPLSDYLLLTGGTLTGPLVLAADAANPLEPVALQQLNAAIAAIPLGDYALLDSPVFINDPTAPTPAPGDNDSSLATTAFVTAALAPAFNDVGRNLIHNPLFNVAQRGTTGFTANGYTMDRWQSVFLATGQTVAIQQYAFTPAQAAVLGDEAAKFALLSNFTGVATTGSYILVSQPIENVLRLSGKTVTVSFWVTSGAALNLGVCLTQNFGTGGSPSAQVSVTGRKVAVTTFWQRYSLTFTLPTASGKTFGSNNNNATALEFWYSSDIATYGARNANLGAQSGAVNIWGVQLEIGTVMTPLEKPDPQQDLAKCQRFYQVGAAYFTSYGAAASPVQFSVPLPVTMRGSPTLTTNPVFAANCSAFSFTALSGQAVALNATCTALGPVQSQATFTASADL